jgi:hypothetical protein
MKCIDIQLLFDDYSNDELKDNDKIFVEDHVTSCHRCKIEFNEYLKLKTQIKNLPDRIEPPRDLWPDIDRRCKLRNNVTVLEGNGNFGSAGNNNSGYNLFRQNVKRHRRFRAVLLAVAIVALLFIISLLYVSDSEETTWSVDPVDGIPKVGSQVVDHTRQLRRGDWLETNGNSRARLQVGLIGQVEVNPNSLIRILNTEIDEHRIELNRGSIHALIWAPPRIFFVDTPSATAVDLGCEYTLTVDQDGSSELHVLSGWVALELHGRESIVPAGVTCYSRPEIGPGTPFRADASPRLIAALENFDFEGEASESLYTVLNEARSDDVITLWHLLLRSKSEREKIYDRISELVEIPESVDRTKIIAGNEKELYVLHRYLKLGGRGFWRF